MFTISFNVESLEDFKKQIKTLADSFEMEIVEKQEDSQIEMPLNEALKEVNDSLADISDRGVHTPDSRKYKEELIKKAFAKKTAGRELTPEEQDGVNNNNLALSLYEMNKKEWNLKDINTFIQLLNEAKGLAYTRKTLQKYKARTAKELKPMYYSAFIEECKRVSEGTFEDKLKNEINEKLKNDNPFGAKYE